MVKMDKISAKKEGREGGTKEDCFKEKNEKEKRTKCYWRGKKVDESKKKNNTKVSQNFLVAADIFVYSLGRDQ